VIHFDFDDRYQDELVVGTAISRREALAWAIVVHLALVLVLRYAPTLSIFQPTAEELDQQRLEELARRERQRESPRFVFVEPRLDVPAPRPPERADLSDLDRRSQTRERAPVPQNPLPFSRGDSAERAEAAPPAAPPKGVEAPPVPEPQPEPETEIARTLPPAPAPLPRPPEPRPRPPGSILGEAVRNLDKYVRNQTFNNPQGGTTDPGSSIQFDTKGVEFGPWVRRFVSQVRRNWFVPLAAMNFRGHVVLQFNVHRDGHITDLNIIRPSDIPSFNRAAYNAILSSNPTEPLPPEYPDEQAFFTVTFYYNEQPGS
jgi:TonB family protein